MVDRAIGKFPTWPTDPLHAIAILGEEHGELVQAVLQATYSGATPVRLAHVREEAIQTAAMALRFLLGIDTYIYRQSPQVPHQDQDSDPYAALQKIAQGARSRQSRAAEDGLPTAEGLG